MSFPSIVISQRTVSLSSGVIWFCEDPSSFSNLRKSSYLAFFLFYPTLREKKRQDIEKCCDFEVSKGYLFCNQFQRMFQCSFPLTLVNLRKEEEAPCICYFNLRGKCKEDNWKLLMCYFKLRVKNSKHD